MPVDIFIGIMRLSRLVRGPYTGTVHAASAVKTPTISYCGPCFKRRCEKILCGRRDVTGVLDAIDDQLKQTPKE